MLDRKKVVTPGAPVWQTTPMGRMRVMNSTAMTQNRQFGVDVFELTVPAGSRSGKHWKMADEILYVLDGEGYSLHSEVQAEIAEKYYARIAKEPTPARDQQGRHALRPAEHDRPALRGRRHAAAPAVGAEPGLRETLGYDNVHYFAFGLESGTARRRAGATKG